MCNLWNSRTERENRSIWYDVHQSCGWCLLLFFTCILSLFIIHTTKIPISRETCTYKAKNPTTKTKEKEKIKIRTCSRIWCTFNMESDLDKSIFVRKRHKHIQLYSSQVKERWNQCHFLSEYWDVAQEQCIVMKSDRLVLYGFNQVNKR